MTARPAVTPPQLRPTTAVLTPEQLAKRWAVSPEIHPALCLRRAAPIALFRLCARFVADSGASQRMSARVSLGYAKKPSGVAA